MNEDGAVQAVYNTINDNKASLVSGISQNGLARQISFLADNLIAMPTAYYAVAVHCERIEEYNMPNVGNTMLATPYATTYQMMVRLGDMVNFDPDDAVFGSTAATNFRDFCDKVVQLFRRDQTWYPNASARPRYKVILDPSRGRVVTKENDLPNADPTSVFLSATIRFTFVGCND